MRDEEDMITRIPRFLCLGGDIVHRTERGADRLRKMLRLRKLLTRRERKIAL